MKRVEFHNKELDVLTLTVPNITGANGFLLTGAYGSVAKGFANDKYSDVDYYVPTMLSALQAQQILFKSQEHFEKKVTMEEVDLKLANCSYPGGCIDRQFKLVPLQHWVSQVFGSNYDYCVSVLNANYVIDDFKHSLELLKDFVNNFTNLTTVMHARSRNDYEGCLKNYIEARDHFDEEEVHKTGSRLVGALHGHMIASVIAGGAVTKFSELPQNFGDLLDVYKTINEPDILYSVPWLAEMWQTQVFGNPLPVGDSTVQMIVDRYAKQKPWYAKKIVALSDTDKKKAHQLQRDFYTAMMQCLTIMENGY